MSQSRPLQIRVRTNSLTFPSGKMGKTGQLLHPKRCPGPTSGCCRPWERLRPEQGGSGWGGSAGESSRGWRQLRTVLPSAAQRCAEPAAISLTPARPDPWGSQGLTPGGAQWKAAARPWAGAREGLRAGAGEQRAPNRSPGFPAPPWQGAGRGSLGARVCARARSGMKMDLEGTGL